MPRSKKEPEAAAPEVESPPRPKLDGREEVISIKCTTAFKEWYERYAEHERMPGVLLIEKVLVDGARRAGFSEAAPKRTRR